MIYLDITKDISGDLLQQELLIAGLETEVTVYSYPEGQKIQLNNVEESDRALAQSIYDAHIAPAPIQPTIEQKLASVGLNLDDLKLALGL